MPSGRGFRVPGGRTKTIRCRFGSGRLSGLMNSKQVDFRYDLRAMNLCDACYVLSERLFLFFFAAKLVSSKGDDKK